MNTIYTYGYLAGTPEHLAAAVYEHDAVLVDIRYMPYSRLPQWRSGSLRQPLGNGRYRFCGELGNVNYQGGGPIRLAYPDAGVAVVAALLSEHPVILLCGCRDVLTCHRLVAADLVAGATGAAVVHLPGPGGR